MAILDFRRTRADRGLRRRIVDPLLHKLLLWSGIDTQQDLDDDRFQRRWAEGKALLREALVDVDEEPNVGGTGFLLWGRAPDDS